MFERFTDRARRVVVLAQEEARLLNHGYIGTEHLLLGMLREGEGVAALALVGLHLDLELARGVVRELNGPGDSAPSGHIPFSPRAKTVFEQSLRESLQLAHNYIGTEHLLLGLLRDEKGGAARVLAKQGVALADVRQKVLDILKGAADVIAEPRAPAGAPVCPGCAAPLEGQLGIKIVEATGDDTGEPIPVPVVYCRRCGRALGLTGK
jgi:ATP-dependent Clp protease ATP-binding subunit ClpC